MTLTLLGVLNADWVLRALLIGPLRFFGELAHWIDSGLVAAALALELLLVGEAAVTANLAVIVLRLARIGHAFVELAVEEGKIKGEKRLGLLSFVGSREERRALSFEGEGGREKEAARSKESALEKKRKENSHLPSPSLDLSLSTPPLREKQNQRKRPERALEKRRPRGCCGWPRRRR